MASGISLREQHVDVSVDIDGRCLIGLTSLSLDVPTALLNAAQQAGERVRRALEEISGDATAEAAVKEAAASVEASVDTANGAEVSASATTGDRCGASSDVCGRAAEAVSSAAAETEENCERKALRDPLPFAVPLYLPPCCRILGCSVERSRASFSIGEEEECREKANAEATQRRLQDDEGSPPKGVRFDLLWWRETYKRALEKTPGRLLYVQFPPHVQQGLATKNAGSKTKVKVRLAITFLLSGLECGASASTLQFAPHSYRDARGRRVEQVLLQTALGASPSPPWFPTLPLTLAAPATAAPSATCATHASLHCNWKVAVEVPLGCVAVMPGKLVRRSLCPTPRSSKAFAGAAEDVAAALKALKSTDLKAQSRRGLFRRCTSCVDCQDQRESEGDCACAFAPGALLDKLLLSDAAEKERQGLPRGSLLRILVEEASAAETADGAAEGSSLRVAARESPETTVARREVFVYEILSSSRKGSRSAGGKPQAGPSAAAGEGPSGAATEADAESLRCVLNDLLPHQLGLFVGSLAAVSGNFGVPFPVNAETLGRGGARQVLSRRSRKSLAEGEDKTSNREGHFPEQPAISFPGDCASPTSAEGCQGAAPVVTYLTLEGLDEFLVPTTASVCESLKLLSRLFQCDPPFRSLTVLFFPLMSGAISKEWDLDYSGAADAAAVASAADVSAGGLREVSDHALFDVATGRELNCAQVPQYRVCGNLVVLPLECMCSVESVGVLGICYGLRTMLFEAIAHLWMEAYLPIGRLLERTKVLDLLHVSTIIRKLLVDMYIEASFGSVELRIRRWERLQRFAALAEWGFDEYPLDPLSALDAGLSEGREGRCWSEESRKPPSQCQQYASQLPLVETLVYSEIFQLKCAVVACGLEANFASHPLFSDSFFVKFCVNMFLSKLSKKKELPTSEKFWKKLLSAATHEYARLWNLLPQVKAGARAAIRVRSGKALSGVKALELQNNDGTHALNLQDHESLSQLEDALRMFRLAFISGTGCPQITQVFLLQLQRKGSAMEVFSFFVDLIALQPPLQLTEACSENCCSFRGRGAKESSADRRSKTGAGSSFTMHDQGVSVFYLADVAGLAAFNVWQAREVLRLQRTHSSSAVTLHEGNAALTTQPTSWQSLVLHGALPQLGPAPLRWSDRSGGCSECQHPKRVTSLLLRGDNSTVAAAQQQQLRELLEVPQSIYDPIDVVGRDGNFILGFGYVGETAAPLNAGRGALWESLQEAKRRYALKRLPESFAESAVPSLEQQRDASSAGVAGGGVGGDEEFAALCVDNERNAKTPDALADATASGGNACSATAESLCSVGLYLQSQPPATLTPALRALLQGRPTHFLPRLEKAEFGGKTDSAAGAALPPPVVVGRGEVFCAPASQTPPPVYQPLLTLRHASLHLSLSAGFEKFWLPAFSLSVVEDDGIRSCAIKLKEGALPLRKKVALKGDRMLHGANSSKVLLKAADAAAAATDAPAAAAAAAQAAAAERPDSAAATSVGPQAAGANPYGSGERITFAGQFSNSDRALIECLKRSVLQQQPSLLCLDNRSLVAKVNSKAKLPVLWLRADPLNTWIARIRRCQSGSMWAQQLFNENNVGCLLEACTALGALKGCGGSPGLEKDSVVSSAVDTLQKAMGMHRWHPFFRSRIVYSLCALHNSTPTHQSEVWGCFLNYLHTIHGDAHLENDGTNCNTERALPHQQPHCSVESGGTGFFSPAAPATCEANKFTGAPFSHGMSAQPLCQSSCESIHPTLRVNDLTSIGPEAKFLKHFYASISMLRDESGLTPTAAVDALLQPLLSLDVSEGNSAAASLTFAASLLECIGNLRWTYLPNPPVSERTSSYFTFLQEAGKERCTVRLDDNRRIRKKSGIDSSTQLIAHCRCSCADAIPLGCDSCVFSKDSGSGPDVSGQHDRRIDIAWMNLWRFFRLDAMRAMASPRRVITCAFLRVVSRHPIFRDLARHAFLGVAADTTSHSRYGRHLEAHSETPCLSLEGESFGVPFDFCLFLPLPSIRRRVRAVSPVAAQLLQAYDDPHIHREALQALMTACCEGAVRVYRVDLGVTAGTPGVYNGVGSMSQYTIASLFVSCEEQVLRVQLGLGIYAGVQLAEVLSAILPPSQHALRSYAWVCLREAIQNLAQKNPAALLPFSSHVVGLLSPGTMRKSENMGCGAGPAKVKAKRHKDKKNKNKHDHEKPKTPSLQKHQERHGKSKSTKPFDVHGHSLKFGTLSEVEQSSEDAAAKVPLNTQRRFEPDADKVLVKLENEFLKGSCAHPHFFSVLDAAKSDDKAACRPVVCSMLGCLGCEVDWTMPRHEVALNVDSMQAQIRGTAILQNHLVACCCFIAQACCSFLHCCMHQQVVKQAELGQNHSLVEQQIECMDNIRSFLFGAGVPPCWTKLQQQLASTLYTRPCSGIKHTSKQHSKFLSGTINGQVGVEPSAASGAAAFAACYGFTSVLKPNRDDGILSATTLPCATALRCVATVEGGIVGIPDECSRVFASFVCSGNKQQKLWRFKRKYLDGRAIRSDWREVAADAIAALLQQPEAAWFANDPAASVEGYKKVIKDPMWLRKVLAKIGAGLYAMPYHLKQDVALIFKNARTFNLPQDKPYRDCVVLEQKFNELWAAINAAFQSAAKSRRLDDADRLHHQTLNHAPPSSVSQQTQLAAFVPQSFASGFIDSRVTANPASAEVINESSHQESRVTGLLSEEMPAETCVTQPSSSITPWSPNMGPQGDGSYIPCAVASAEVSAVVVTPEFPNSNMNDDSYFQNETRELISDHASSVPAAQNLTPRLCDESKDLRTAEHVATESRTNLETGNK